MSTEPLKPAVADSNPETTQAPHRNEDPLLVETAWEVCQQLGGIYTVIRSKVPSIVERWGRRYCLLGPYNPAVSPTEFEETPPTGPFGEAVKLLQKQGIEAHHGHWLITGRPRVILLNPASAMGRLADIKYFLWKDHDIGVPGRDELVDQVTAFGDLVREFFKALTDVTGGNRRVIGHFHEWMAGTVIPRLRREQIPVGIVFTTHATLLGRYLAMNDPWFYDHLPFVDWKKEATHFNIEAQVRIERAAAHGAHVFTTVSEITGLECEHLLGRKPDQILPNGLNIQRFVALHEFQNLHRVYKEKINEFIMGHFFPSYPFDLDNTLYFLISGRYEYRNKGFDMTIEAMARLNWRMKQTGTKRTVVFFVITRQPYRGIGAEALRRRATLEEMRRTVEAIKEQVGERLFTQAAMGHMPDLDSLVDDYWMLRLRRMLYAWKTQRLPTIVTHDLIDDGRDDILNQLRTCKLINMADDPVKVVYHPDFVTASDPLFGMDYDQFVRGCHLGIFPSAYEPWGYAPLECAALGIPAITSDLSGFGTYLLRHMPDHQSRGLVVLNRRHHSYDATCNQLTDWLFHFVKLERRERIALRNRVESSATEFDWHTLGQYYAKAYDMVFPAPVA